MGLFQDGFSRWISLNYYKSLSTIFIVLLRLLNYGFAMIIEVFIFAFLESILHDLGKLFLQNVFEI